jgi:GTP-binding protein HflX
VHSPENRLAEARGLAEAIDLEIADAILVPVPNPKPGLLFGSGKVDELKAMINSLDCGLVIVDHAVTPVQQRNLEKTWGAKVLDRTGLILEIFGRRARTREGRLQVELAHLSYQKSRLVRAWTHLERQRGGRGFLGGPGEAQIELDRRLIQDRIDAITKELEVVVRTRDLHRAGRRRTPYPIVAIVGYTNAGKSTLFNRVTGAAVLAKDQVFATLDPTMREVRLGGGRRIILSDTVGFISDLPTMLVAAFRATLEEVIEADLILHVRDIAHPESAAQARDVEGVLSDLGIDMTPADKHIVEVWNKADLLDPEARDEARRQVRFADNAPVLVSAVTGEGLDGLLRAIDQRLGKNDEVLTIVVPAHEGRLVNWLYENADVLERTSDEETGAITTRIRIASEKKGRLMSHLERHHLRPL